MSSFWSGWIILLTSVTIVGVTWLLFANRQRSGNENEATTGHEYDGIQEYDNPLPAWWFAMFLITIIWGIGYLIIYPGMGSFDGVIGWSQLGQYEEEVAEAEEKYRAMRDRYLAMPLTEVAADAKARRMGQRIYSNNCSQCHGLDARGAYGFPNLADGDWLWGGEAEQIHQSITQGRRAAMPAWGETLGETGVQQATQYVLALNGRNTDKEAAAAGEKLFKTYCVACHGPEGKGNPMLGAPNLTNGIWLYGGTEEQIAHSLRAGRNGVMPAFGNNLGEDKIHLVAAYIYGISR